MEQYYYSSATGQTYSAYQMQALFGINVETTGISILNDRGFYPVQPSTPDFDLKLYNTSSVWNIVPILPSGEGAQLVFTPVAKPLPEAKENATVELKQRGDEATAQVLMVNYLTSDVISAVASQDSVDRPAPLQAVLTEMVAVTDALGADLIAVDAATSVDEINNVVNPPTGILFTGRGSGLGPEDLNPSSYVEFNSVSLTEADTELYIPGTATTIPYGVPNPGEFDSLGNAFNPGNYLMQIREVATSRVIAEFEVPLNPTGENVSF